MTKEETHGQATELAAYYRIQAQRTDEGDHAFCQRVAGRLRKMGHVVEAHEIACGRRFDEAGGESVLAGLSGAVALALDGRRYSRNGEAMLGDEFAAGTIARNPKPQMTPGMALLMVELFGRK
jgi:hypothetical protein